MQLTKLFVLSFAAAALAAPTVDIVEKRTDPTGVSCAQGAGTFKCCTQKPTQVPVAQSGIQQSLAGLLGVLPSIIPQIIPTVSVAAQCFAVIVNLQAQCNGAQVCCLTNSSGSSPSNTALIQLLSNDNLNLCPTVTA